MRASLMQGCLEVAAGKGVLATKFGVNDAVSKYGPEVGR